VFLTAHRADGAGLSPERNDPASTTYVVYMPGNRYAELAAELRAAGIGAEVSCVVISRATTREEKVYRTTVGKLPECPAAAAPSLLVIGEVAGADAGDEVLEGEISSAACEEVLSLALQHPLHEDVYGGNGAE
jgi:siroheme synthase